MDALANTTFTKDDLLACARGEMFGPGNAQLPAPPMLMFDRITNVTAQGGAFGKGQITAELDVDPELWVFACHFLGDPVMPGCLGLEDMWQLVGFFLGWCGAPGRGRALGGGEAKFTGQGTTKIKRVVYRIDFQGVIIRKLVMGGADGGMEADGKLIYEAKDPRVGLFNAADLV